jgi:hypothetical protein
MNSKIIMTASAIALAIIGLTLTFLPDELLVYLNISSSRTLLLLTQILGALYFAFAMLNWMAKGSITGGIYNRPIVLANFAHFLIGGLSLLKALMSSTNLPMIIWVLAGIYLLFMILFGMMLFRNPSALRGTKDA